VKQGFARTTIGHIVNHFSLPLHSPSDAGGTACGPWIGSLVALLHGVGVAKTEAL